MPLVLQHFESHNPLVFLAQMYNHNLRWALAVLGYNIEIKHKKGVDNVVADALSCV